MGVHRKIIVIAAIGMLSFLLVVIPSVREVMKSFSTIIGEANELPMKMHQVQDLQKELDLMATSLHYYITTLSQDYRQDYDQAHSEAQKQLSALDPREMEVLLSEIRQAITVIERGADAIFGSTSPQGESDRLVEMEAANARIAWSVERHFDRERQHQTTRFANYFSELETRVLILYILTFALSFLFLIGFGVYLYNTIAVPLKDIWIGATEISLGHLDYRIRLRETSDIAPLAERFNEMAARLKRSYQDIEQKLRDRTNELAAIDAVALTLGQATGLRDMLTRSLDKILSSLPLLEQKGGVFLIEPDNATLRLIAHIGLTPAFVEREHEVPLGECLCGRAAVSGEIVYSGDTRTDPQHTRGSEGDVHCHLIIPIKTRGLVLGVIFLYPKQEFKPQSADMQMLETIGAQLGMAVENLRFYAEVKESSEKYWDLFENSHDILFTLDRQGILTAANGAAEQFSGYDKTALIGKNIHEFLTPDGADHARRLLRGDASLSGQVIEFEVVRRDGSHAFLEMSARKMLSRKQVVGYQISARDMTDQKQIREKLLRVERLGAIAEIVVTVRHEINNPLTTVIGNTELLIERYGEQGGDLATRLNTILNNSLRIAEIVKQLKAVRHNRPVEYVGGVVMTDIKQTASATDADRENGCDDQKTS